MGEFKGGELVEIGNFRGPGFKFATNNYGWGREGGGGEGEGEGKRGEGEREGRKEGKRGRRTEGELLQRLVIVMDGIFEGCIILLCKKKNIITTVRPKK